MEENVYKLTITQTQLEMLKKAVNNMPAPSCDTEEYDEYTQLKYDLDTI